MYEQERQVRNNSIPVQQHSDLMESDRPEAEGEVQKAVLVSAATLVLMMNQCKQLAAQRDAANH